MQFQYLQPLDLQLPINGDIIVFTYPRDTVFLVLDPVHPVHAVRESEFCHPLVSVLPPLCCYFCHSYQLPKVDLKPFFSVISFSSPRPMSLTVGVDVQPGPCWDKFGIVAGRGRKRSVWYVTVFQSERKRAAVHYKIM